MNRRRLARATLATLLATPAAAIAETAATRRLVIHVGANDPSAMHTALHNIANFVDHYTKLGEAAAVELVANGPGYAMLRADTSPVAEEIAALHKRLPDVVFSACQNSRQAIAAAEGKTPEQIPEVPAATDVPAGIARLVELQDQGWRYVRA